MNSMNMTREFAFGIVEDMKRRPAMTCRPISAQLPDVNLGVKILMLKLRAQFLGIRETFSLAMMHTRIVCVSPRSYEQLKDACRLFERIPGTYLRDIVLHVDQSTDVKSLTQDVRRFEGCFDVLGFTEKEIAGTWFKGINFIDKLRKELSGELGVYVPICWHLFGCFDPKSIINFFLVGADIFDGLSWLRYFINNRSTLYIREYEALVPFSQHSQLSFYHPEVIVANNIEELQRLRNDLSYSAVSGDYSSFQDEMNFVYQVLSNGGDR